MLKHASHIVLYSHFFIIITCSEMPRVFKNYLIGNAVLKKNHLIEVQEACLMTYLYVELQT